MSNKNRLLIIITTVLTLILAAGTAYGYFDILSGTSGGDINTGEWGNGVIAYLNAGDNSVPKDGGGSYDALGYYAELLFDDTEYGADGKLESGEIKAAYENYGLQNIKDLIDAIREYGNNFFASDAAGNIRLINANSSPETVTPLQGSLNPGECVQITKVLLTADLSDDIYWAPVAYAVSIELPGYDISDWAVEILYAPPGGAASTFAYQYLIRDASGYNVNRAQGQIEKSSNGLSLIDAEVSTHLTVFRLHNKAYTPYTFIHTLSGPSFGSWSRFVSGPNLRLGPPSGSTIGSQQQLETLSPASRAGIILMGKSNGTKVECRIGFL